MGDLLAACIPQVDTACQRKATRILLVFLQKIVNHLIYNRQQTSHAPDSLHDRGFLAGDAFLTVQCHKYHQGLRLDFTALSCRNYIREWQW
jgi:hypothetical protein